ncbi:MAG: family beta-propeller repeat protein, partial [Acidimicrobiia bacterium]|nr:family beta-propeller repeat protein [Acidimicrobiia bacterium]
SSSPANRAYGAPVSVAPVPPSTTQQAVLAPSSVSATTAPAAPTTAAGPPAVDRHLVLAQAIGGAISPKSVVASGTGLVFAQNMIYTHTVTVYDATGALKATIADSIRPSDFGFADRTAVVKGGPVEADFTSDGRYAYVSNYSMYGPGYRHPGDDVCGPQSGIDRSFVYRIDTQKLAIDQLIAVGSVPKYVRVTPDDQRVLVSNWCSYDLSVIDAASAHEIKRVALGRYPRGIVISPDSHTAFVAVMGSRDIARVSLQDFSVSWIRNVGSGPRHLVMSPDGTTVYATLNADDAVVRIDVASGKVTGKVVTGHQPRSMDISADGSALYVVNYESSTMTKVRVSDLKVIQSVPTRVHPIGVAYEPTTGAVWVSCYRGTIMRFLEQ